MKLLILALALLTLIAVGLFFSFTHKCKTGRYETKRIPESTVTTFHYARGQMWPVKRVVPEHDEQQWVCECGKTGIPR